ncbi:hypothetical protein CCHR01_17525 [Colletotrichum chrysophilum]|uniref:Uncharacterized protein n=1 Tax=Colletotrichum chrysophilum TaxID=1836956 RepID=A0AAD9E6T3_9PEZI|nr:hypothetical protein CCHR01_17525 [Colletotrichum chrysophilum]
MQRTKGRADVVTYLKVGRPPPRTGSNKAGALSRFTEPGVQKCFATGLGLRCVASDDGPFPATNTDTDTDTRLNTSTKANVGFAAFRLCSSNIKSGNVFIPTSLS